jgi:putative MATE family efflux protein
VTIGRRGGESTSFEVMASMSQMVISPPAAPVPVVSALPARTRLLLEAPILPTLLRLAAPNVVVVTVQAASSTVDAFFVGRLGAEVLAGVSLVFPAWMLMVTMSAGGIGGGIASAVARALGGGRRAEADALVAHALAIGLALSAIFTAGLLWGGPALYAAMGGSGPTLDAALAYSVVIFAGALAVWLVNTLASVLRGSGEMLFPAAVVVAGELLHCALAPLLIFGPGPFPALGVTGAAVSLVTSYGLRAAALAGYVLTRRSVVTLSLVPLRLRRALFFEILRVGLPGSINTLLTNANVMVVTGLVGSFGTFALAGYGVGARLEYLQIPLVFGFGTALVTMVGTNVGAGELARARRVAWVGAGLAAAVTGSVGVLAALLPRAWIGTFSSQPEVLAAGETYLRIVGPSYGFFGLGLALYFASQGAGRLIWPLAAGFARLLVAVGGGWLAVTWLGELPALFAAITLGFLVFGGAQAAAINATLRQATGAAGLRLPVLCSHPRPRR